MNYFVSFKDQGTATGAVVEGVGTAFTSQGTIPRLKINMENSWKWRQWTVSAFVNYSGHYEEFSNPRNAEREVEAYTTADLQVSYKMRTPYLGGNTAFTVGLINATDVQPPFVSANVSGSGNTAFDAQIADPRGRFFYVQMRQSF